MVKKLTKEEKIELGLNYNQRTNEEFLEECKEKGVLEKIEILGVYVDSKTKIRCRCKIHDYIWEALPDYLLTKKRCPKCGWEINASKRTKTNEEFLKECEEKGILNKIKILEPYKNTKSKILCQCLIHKNFKWYVEPGHLLSGQGCPWCGYNIETDTLASNPQELFIERFNKLEISERIEVLEPFKKNTSKLNCYCKIHNEYFKKTPVELLRGIGCSKCVEQFHNPICIQKTNEQFLQECKDLNLNLENRFEILEPYNKAHLPLKCFCKIHKKEFYITPISILQGHGCPDCGREDAIKKRTTSFEDFLEKFKNNGKGNFDNIEIIGEYINMSTPILCHCKKHNIDWKVIPTLLVNGAGCFYCGNEKIGNALRKSEEYFDKQLHDLFPNIDRVGTYINDSTKIEFHCNDCSNNFFSTPGSILSKRKGCSFCSDGLSFPNKFLRNMLGLLKIKDFNFEWHPEWIEPYRYDSHFWQDGKEYIIEADGGYHKKVRKSKNKSKSKRKKKKEITIEEIKRRDKFKNDKAKEHNIELIRIDCDKRNLREIVNQFKDNEKLNEIFNFIDFDWDLCYKKSLKSIMKDVCLYYENNKTVKVKEIAEIFGLSVGTIQRYLKDGNKFNMCNYPDGREKDCNHGQIEIYSFDSNNNKLDLHKSIGEAAKVYNTTHGSVKNIASGRQKTPYKGLYLFRYKEDVIIKDDKIIPLPYNEIKLKYERSDK